MLPLVFLGLAVAIAVLGRGCQKPPSDSPDNAPDSEPQPNMEDEDITIPGDDQPATNDGELDPLGIEEAHSVGGRLIHIPEVVTGRVNGNEVSLYPRNSWFSFQGNDNVINFDGRYIVVVGPRIMNPNYSDSGRIWASDFDFPIRINAVLEHRTTGEERVIECISNNGAKAHTFNTYPTSDHPRNQYFSDDVVSFDIENGILQTGISYPRASNSNFEPQFASRNMDASTIEFVGRGLDFNPHEYRLLRLTVLD
jgi:hypothetical protein